MNHNFDARNNSQPIPPEPNRRDIQDQGTEVDTALCGTPDCLDNLKRDRFEMISAYLDGEGSSQERRQVECWLQNDTTVQQLYARLLRLRQSIQAMPVPVSSAAAIEQTIEQVFARLDAEQPKTVTVPFAQAELLSAYLDGEVTAAERRQVEGWLAHDPALQRLYSQMQRMQHSVQAMPVPAATISADVMADRVMARVQQRRAKRTWLWGGAAAAAAIAGVVTTLVSGINGPAPQFASNSTSSEQTPSQVAVSDDALMIALDQPIIEIPKVPASHQMPNLLSTPSSQDVQ